MSGRPALPPEPQSFSLHCVWLLVAPKVCVSTYNSVLETDSYCVFVIDDKQTKPESHSEICLHQNGIINSCAEVLMPSGTVRSIIMAF